MTTAPTLHHPATVAIDMPLWRARMAAQAVLPHISTDDVTPVLTVAHAVNGYLVASDRYSVGQFTLQGQDTPRPDRSLVGAAVKYGGISEERYQALLEDWEAQHEVRYYADGERTTDTQEMLIPLDAIRRMATLSSRLLPCGRVAEATARVVIEARDGQPHVREEYLTHKWVDVVLYEQDRQVFRQTFLGVTGMHPPVHRLLAEWVPAEEAGTLNFTTWNLAKMTKFAAPREIIRLTPGKPAENMRQHKLAPTRLEVGKDFVALLQPNLDLR